MSYRTLAWDWPVPIKILTRRKILKKQHTYVVFFREQKKKIKSAWNQNDLHIIVQCKT